MIEKINTIKTKEDIDKILEIEKEIESSKIITWSVGISEKEKEKCLILRDKILNFGGDDVVIWRGEEDAEKIVERGQFWCGTKIIMMKGEPNKCHSNSANLWSQNKEICSIATGYALSKDGLWRQHSWLIKGDKIVETTIKRISYFGFVLTEDEAELFLYDNS